MPFVPLLSILYVSSVSIVVFWPWRILNLLSLVLTCRPSVRPYVCILELATQAQGDLALLHRPEHPLPLRQTISTPPLSPHTQIPLLNSTSASAVPNMSTKRASNLRTGILCLCGNAASASGKAKMLVVRIRPRFTGRTRWGRLRNQVRCCNRTRMRGGSTMIGVALRTREMAVWVTAWTAAVRDLPRDWDSGWDSG